MRFFFVLIFFQVWIAGNACGQNLIARPGDMHPPRADAQIEKAGLFSDAEVTSVLLWIKDGVKPHYHAAHSEHVYVLKGRGTMRLGDKTLKIRKGDFVFIPKGTIHAVEVDSKILKVISIQAPEFTGKDRIWAE